MSSDCEAYDDIGEDCSDDNVDLCEFPSCLSDNVDCDVEKDCADEIPYGSCDNPESEVDDDYSADDIQNSSADNEDSDIENENSVSNNVDGEKHVLTLDLICRQCISENFGRFNTAYNTSTDPDLKHNLNFLQKLYSSYLASEMSNDGYLDREYLKFAVNEYSKELDVSLLIRDCSYDLIINRMSEVGHGFLKVSFSTISQYYGTAAEITIFMNSVINLLPNVNILHLGSYANDETLKIISTTCMDLKELNIDHSLVTAEGLKSLCPCTNLNKISLYGIKDIEECIKFLLKNLPALEDIRYPNLPEVIFSMHEQDMKNNCLDSAQSYSLTKLDIKTDRGLSLFVKVCPHIKTLSKEIIRVEDLKLITSFSKLEKLYGNAHIDGLPFPDLDSFLTASGKGMEELNVGSFSLSACVLIEMCTNLKSLYLREISFRMTGKETIGRKLNNLKMLYLYNIDFSNLSNEQSFAMLLNSSPNLKNLYIHTCECQRYGEVISKFCEKSNVESITFTSCDIDEALLTSILLSNLALNTVYIDSCNKIGQEEIQRLESIALSSKNNAEIILLDDFYDYESSGSDDDWYPDYDGNYDHDL